LALHPIQSFESSFEFVDMLDRAVRPFGFYLPMFAVFENYTKYRISRRPPRDKTLSSDPYVQLGTDRSTTRGGRFARDAPARPMTPGLSSMGVGSNWTIFKSSTRTAVSASRETTEASVLIRPLIATPAQGIKP
jgi:hypothetical protein